MTPILLVPGLLCTSEVFGPQISALWPYGAVMVASTLDGNTIPEMAAAILRDAPPRFALAGISMGGYLSLEIMRQAPERVTKLALLDTSARPDTPEATKGRRELVAQVRAGDLETALTPMLEALFDHHDAALLEVHLRMARVIGKEGFARQQEAIIARADSRPSLAKIAVPTLVLVGDADKLTPLDRSEEVAAASRMKPRPIDFVRAAAEGSTVRENFHSVRGA